MRGSAPGRHSHEHVEARAKKGLVVEALSLACPRRECGGDREEDWQEQGALMLTKAAVVICTVGNRRDGVHCHVCVWTTAQKAAELAAAAADLKRRFPA